MDKFHTAASGFMRQKIEDLWHVFNLSNALAKVKRAHS